MSKLVRYRFCTRAVDDYRPLVDTRHIGMPWWCTGSGHGYVTIVCYLPENEPLEKYWDDAFDIYEEHVDEIVYTDRFQKPEWLERSKMEARTESEIKAYVEGWNACHKLFCKCLEGRKSVIDAVRKMELYTTAVNGVLERSEDESETD